MTRQKLQLGYPRQQGPPQFLQTKRGGLRGRGSQTKVGRSGGALGYVRYLIGRCANPTGPQLLRGALRRKVRPCIIVAFIKIPSADFPGRVCGASSTGCLPEIVLAYCPRVRQI